MNAKEYLSQAIWLDRRIDSKLQQLSSLKSLALKVTTTYDNERVCMTKDKSPMENTIIKLIDLEHEIDEDIDRLVDLKKEIMDVINGVEDPNCRLLLELRYISGHTWEEVAEKMQYDLRWTYRMHGKALKMVKIKRSHEKPLKDTNKSATM
jgi:hypothetical protein